MQFIASLSRWSFSTSGWGKPWLGGDVYTVWRNSCAKISQICKTIFEYSTKMSISALKVCYFTHNFLLDFVNPHFFQPLTMLQERQNVFHWRQEVLRFLRTTLARKRCQRSKRRSVSFSFDLLIWDYFCHDLKCYI